MAAAPPWAVCMPRSSAKPTNSFARPAFAASSVSLPSSSAATSALSRATDSPPPSTTTTSPSSSSSTIGRPRRLWYGGSTTASCASVMPSVMAAGQIGARRMPPYAAMYAEEPGMNR